MKKRPSHATTEPIVPLSPAPVATPSEPAARPANRTGGRIKKSAQVDEQIFQESLAISLANEQRQSGEGRKQPGKRRAKEAVAGQTDQQTGIIVDEFQTMIDHMLPSARQERVACLRNAGKRVAGHTKAKQHKKQDKKQDKRHADQPHHQSSAKKRGHK